MLVKIKSDALRNFRISKNLSQNRLSAEAGLSNASVYRMECQQYRVSKIRVAAVAKVLGCELEELICNEEAINE